MVNVRTAVVRSAVAVAVSKILKCGETARDVTRGYNLVSGVYNLVIESSRGVTTL